MNISDLDYLNTSTDKVSGGLFKKAFANFIFSQTAGGTSTSVTGTLTQIVDSDVGVSAQKGEFTATAES